MHLRSNHVLLPLRLSLKKAVRRRRASPTPPSPKQLALTKQDPALAWYIHLCWLSLQGCVSSSDVRLVSQPSQSGFSLSPCKERCQRNGPMPSVMLSPSDVLMLLKKGQQLCHVGTSGSLDVMLKKSRIVIIKTSPGRDPTWPVWADVESSI